MKTCKICDTPITGAVALEIRPPATGDNPKPPKPYSVLYELCTVHAEERQTYIDNLCGHTEGQNTMVSQ